MRVKFYTQGCPKCKVLQKKLNIANIEYELISEFDTNELIEKGIASLPILIVDDTIMKFEDAVKWIREQNK